MSKQMRFVYLLGLTLVTLWVVACGGAGAATQQAAVATTTDATVMAVTLTPEPTDTPIPEPTFTQLPPPIQVFSAFPASEIPQVMVLSKDQVWVEKNTKLTDLEYDDQGRLILIDSSTVAGEENYYYTGEIMHTNGTYCVLAISISDLEGEHPLLDEGYCGNPLDKFIGKSQNEINQMCQPPDGYVNVGRFYEFTDSAGVVNTFKVFEDGMFAAEFSDEDLPAMGLFPCSGIGLVDYNGRLSTIFYGPKEIYVPAEAVVTPTLTPPAELPSVPEYQG